MGADAVSVIFFFMVIFLGFYFKMVWLSIIFVIILLVYLYGAGSMKEVRGEAVPKGPMVRPIVVKRRYVGPESIYPKKMFMWVSKPGWWTGDPWWQYAGKGVSKGLSAGASKIWEGLKGD